ncbi:hypothetical protein D3C81_1905020 [compost metagenome]
MLPFNRQCTLNKRRAADSGQTAFFLPVLGYGAILTHHFSVVIEIDSDVKTRQCDSANDFVDMAEFRFFCAHEFATRRGIVEQIQHF